MKSSLAAAETKEEHIIENSASIDVPDGGYGWVIVLPFFLYTFCTWGANASYAMYQEQYLTHQTFRNAGNLDCAAIGGLALGCGLLLSPIVTWLQFQTSMHIVIGTGIFLQAAALILAAFCTKLWQLYMTQGVLLSFGLAFIFIPGMNLLPQWSRKKRSMATGIGSTGSGIGGIVFNLAMQQVIEVKSVRWALITQFIICVVLGAVALLLTRTRGERKFSGTKQKLRVFDKQVWLCRELG